MLGADSGAMITVVGKGYGEPSSSAVYTALKIKYRPENKIKLYPVVKHQSSCFVHVEYFFIIMNLRST